MTSRTCISMSLFALLASLQGCGTVGPLPGNGSYEIIVKGDPDAMKAFDGLESVCVQTEPPGGVKPIPSEGLEERVYKCPIELKQNNDERLKKFALAYGNAINTKKGHASSHMSTYADARSTAQADSQTDAGASADSQAATAALAVEMLITTGVSCKQMTCGGGNPLYWVPWPYALPCTKRCLQ
jgi:hypothetical protein